MSTDPTQLRSKSPLLFGTCILAGLHISPSLHGSPTHQALYRQVHGLLGRAHLSSAASLDTIQSMLIFSMWDLRPNLCHDHINSWLLSGTAAMRVIMTTPFEQILNTSDTNDHEQVQEQELMRTWNLICLCQLQYVQSWIFFLLATISVCQDLTKAQGFPWVPVDHQLYLTTISTSAPNYFIFSRTMHEMSLC